MLSFGETRVNRRTARVHREGNSLVVVLPKDWTRGMDIEKGDEVEIVYDGEVRVRAIPKARGEPDE